MGILHAFWSTCWLTMFSSDLPDRRHCTMDGKPCKRGVFHAWHSRRLTAPSSSVRRLAFPPAAVVLLVPTFYVATSGRQRGRAARKSVWVGTDAVVRAEIGVDGSR